MASTVSAADLAALEGLLNEFFATQTSNERKREIEQVLTHFGEQTNSWHLCLGFLIANKDNHFVSMFVLTTLETIIRRKWIGMPGNEKVIISTFSKKKFYHTLKKYMKNSVNTYLSIRFL